MRLAALAVLLLLAVPSAVADHPGSNKGLAGLAAPGSLGAAGPLGQDVAVHRLPDVQMAFAEWEARWPNLVDQLTIGTTASGFDLAAIRVTDEEVPYDAAALSTGNKVRVYLDGGHHGNEFLGVELVMYYLEDLLSRAGEPDTAAFLATHEVYATPIINVDGNFADTRKNHRLVDVNRNYDFMWGGPGSGDTPIDFTYRGPEAMSEPEVAANAAFAQSILPDLWITMHTGVAEFYWPWGWTHDPAPDQAFFESLEGPFEAATNGRVDAMQAAELYLAAGATDDYGYGALGIPTFTYEVHEDQFVPVYGQPIPDMIADQLAGLDFMVRNAGRMGAWVEPTVVDGELVLTNTGWAEARDVQVVIDGAPEIIPRLAPGQSTALHGVQGASATITYPVLMINTTQERTHLVPLSAASPEANPIPGVGLLVVLATLAGVVIARRR